MGIGLMGKKLGMTQIFDQSGILIPVTLIKLGKCFVSDIKTKENSGYDAIQIAYVEDNSKKIKISKPELGHLLKNNLPASYHLKEFQTDSSNDFKLGDEISIDLFKIGDLLKIRAKTIGKGFLGNIKLHNFSRGGMSHGSKHHRLQGSLGAGTSPGRVFPGKKMARRSGFENRTISNLKIIEINKEDNILIIKGCIPGKAGNLINIEK